MEVMVPPYCHTGSELERDQPDCPINHDLWSVAEKRYCGADCKDEPVAQTIADLP